MVVSVFYKGIQERIQIRIHFKEDISLSAISSYYN